jgi:hypothetical protein
MERGVKDYGPALYALSPGAFTWTSFRAGVSFDEVSPMMAAKDIDVPVFTVSFPSGYLNRSRAI